MHSKLLPWDFTQKFPKTISPNQNGLIVYLSTDPYIEAILTRNLPKKEKEFHCYTGADITRDFIEEHFSNLSFFSQSENFYIINAEMIPLQNSTLFLEKIKEISGQQVALFFSKSNKFFLELSKHPDVAAFTLEAPKFWDGPKMLQFAIKEKQVSLKPEIVKFLLENVEHNFESFFRALDLIKVGFADDSIDLSKLKLLIIRERFDFFELVDLYFAKPRKFYEVILSNELDFEWLRSTASSMQGHLGKLLFPAEIKMKEKLSKYDQTIIFQSEKLSRSLIQKDLQFFGDLEIMAKSKDQFILDHLRRKIIE
jgi:hypothetical protein